MKVVIFGASGMVGQGVLRECLLDARVDAVLSVGRTSTGHRDEKLQEILLKDVGDLTGVEDRLRGYDACFFCLGVSSAGMSEVDYRRVTYDLTVEIAQTLIRLNPGMTFVYITGAGTDSTEHGRSMWAHVKGQTENALLRMPFKAAYMFRPAVIQPLHGIHSKTRSYRILYAVMWPFIPLVKALSPNSVTTTERVGRAMIRVAVEGAASHVLGTREINALGK
ncbi:MAG: epimerase [Thermoplasmata archaeon]